MRSWAANLLVFCTSAAILVVEIVANRLMAPYVGVSLETYTAAIGTVLAGIAAGSALGGKLADRSDPVRWIGPLLVAGGALTWLALPIVAVVGPGVPPTATGIIVLTAVAFFLPAAVLSAISPLTAKARLAHLGEAGSVVGGLSAAGTAGALTGSFLTGFVLLATLPSRPIVLAVGGSLIVAGAALSWRSMRRRLPLPTAAAVLLAGLGAVTADSPCQFETAYFCATVQGDPARPSGRALVLDTLRHSYIDLDDPTHLEFRYQRLFAALSETLPAGPIDVLHIGGGGFTFPRYVAATRPASRQLALEIDGDLVDIAERELGLQPDERLRVQVGDARTALADLPTDGFDLVVGDAFGSLSVPWHLTTREVVEEVDRLLRPGGLYMINVIDGGANRFARAEVATLLPVFPAVGWVVPVGGVPPLSRANQILVGSTDEDWAPPPLDTADGKSLGRDEIGRLVAGVRPLTDQLAPVDQLLRASLS